MKTCLNFEDSPYKAYDIKQLLESLNFDVVQVDNLEEGMKMVQKRKEAGYEFDLIVSDYYFPVCIHGNEQPAGSMVIPKLMEMGVETPVIICSRGLYKQVPGMVGCISYGDAFWEEDMKYMIENLFRED